MLRQLRRTRQAEAARLDLLRAQAAQEQAEAALRARNEFTSIAAHELRTPLTSLRGYTQLAQRRLAQWEDLQPDSLMKTFAIIERQTRTLEHMISRLLDVSRVDAGKLDVESERCDLVQLIEQAVADVQALGTKHDIVLQAPPSLEAEVDPVRLAQVLRNLLDNAVKYDQQGGQIEVEVAQPTDGLIHLVIRDHGPGIPLQHREQIFDRYFRGQRDRSGLGLGLYIAHEIIRLHQGDMVAEFPEDGGTRIVISLPVSATSDLTPMPPTPNGSTVQLSRH
jgi:signal transduction histidine kinase